MRCAYLILAHRYPHQLARLTAALTLPQPAQAASDKAYIHVDKRSDLAPFQNALREYGLTKGGEYEFVSQRVTGAWGDFSLVQATLNLARACLSDERQCFDYLSLLSGQDYPLTSASERKRRLGETPHAEHMTYFSLPHEGWAMNGGLGRIRRYHNPGLRERIRTSGAPGARYIGAAAALALSLVPRPGGVPGGLTVYGGWQWWTLTAACARYALDYADSHPDFVRFFRYAYIPDELFFQTLIMNSPFAERVTGDYLRYIVWDGIKPRVFDLGNLRELISASQRSLFARKFETDHPTLLALLDEMDTIADEARSYSARIPVVG